MKLLVNLGCMLMCCAFWLGVFTLIGLSWSLSLSIIAAMLILTAPCLLIVTHSNPDEDAR